MSHPSPSSAVIRRLLRASVRAFAELNTIRARDGVPYTYYGCKSDVDEAYFSSVVDELDEAVKVMTGRSAHCHPELYIDDNHDWCGEKSCRICSARYQAEHL